MADEAGEGDLAPRFVHVAANQRHPASVLGLAGLRYHRGIAGLNMSLIAWRFAQARSRFLVEHSRATAVARTFSGSMPLPRLEMQFEALVVQGLEFELQSAVRRLAGAFALGRGSTPCITALRIS